MTARAKTLGVAGTIIDGRLRDLQEHRDLDFPVSSPSSHAHPPAATKERNKPGS